MAITSFLTLCLGGALLTQFERLHLQWVGFAVMFLTAGLLRSGSILYLSHVTDTPHSESGIGRTGFRTFFRTGMSKNFRQFLLFSGLMHLAVLISGPFFVIYMLQDLRLSYWEYGVWLAAAIVGQFVTLPAWGQFGDRFGNKALLVFTGLLVGFLPMLYLFSTAWVFLITVNFFGGVVWAGLGLGLVNYVIDAVEPPDRAKAVAVSSAVNAIGWATGTLIGSWMIGTVPATLRMGALELHPASNLPFIFFLSGSLRLVVCGALLRTFQEPREVDHRPHRRLIWELPLLRSVRHILAPSRTDT
jgi:MFS family permease